jgi:hypothetical protein
MTDVGVAGDGAKLTLEMGVANTGFIVDRIGRDCAPLQYLRELTQNAIEAISDSPGDGGQIVWDVDWNHYDLTGQYKLSITDTGVGMTGPEMLQYINHLSSSTHEQAHDGNFGVGAKVAAATRNHAGLLYLSWKEREGCMTHLWRDPDTGQYGIARAERNGRFHDYLKISSDVKPSNIDDRGTKVVLLGMTDDHNTVEAPEGVDGRQRWIAKYLNTRYFRFPDGIEVKVREGYTAPRDDTRRNFLRNVTGQKAFLDEESNWHGTVALTGATAHVWILNDRPERTKQGDMFATTGHMAALYQDELYELATGRAGVARLQLFGVIFGHSRVVIYVEPANDDRLSSNTARTQLLVDGEPLPWAEWAAEFRDAMPDEVKALMEEIASGSSSHDHKQAIKERLKPIRDLFRITRYRPTPNGKLNVVEETAGGRSKEKDTAPTGKGGRSGGRGGRAGGVYALFVEDDGAPGEEVQGDHDPQVHWISVKDGTRTPDLLEDRAAKFMPDQNILQVNADFRVFTDMVERWSERYTETPGARDAIEQVVQEWYEQALIETVLGAQALQGSPQWTLEDVGRLWSEEGLTASVLQRYHVEMNVKRTLGARLGSLKERTVA